MRVLDIIGEAPVAHGLIKKAEQRAYVVDLMEKVGLSGGYVNRYPHQFSGGQSDSASVLRAPLRSSRR